MFKKIFLLAVLITTIFTSNKLQAQVTPMFCNYVNTSAPSGNAIPLNSSSSNKAQWIFPAGSFNSNGSTGTPSGFADITTIYVRASNVGTANFNNFTVKMHQNGSIATGWLNTNFDTSMTTVLGPTTYTLNHPTAGNWIPILLSTPFSYDPTASLTLEIKQSSVSGVGPLLFEENTGLISKNYGSYTSNTIGTNTTTGTLDFGFDQLPNTPCNGTPIIGSINPGSQTVCPYQSIDFNLPNLNSFYGTNMTFQWQQSTNGGITWVNAVGASPSNSYTFNTNPMVITTMYRMYATCNNSGFTDTTAPVTITVTLPSFAPLPYIQSFENWTNYCGTSDVPLTGTSSLNWSNTPATGENSWRRNNQGSTAGWATTGGMYSPSSSEGQYSARFHQLATTSTGSLDLFLDCSQQAGAKSLFFDYINGGLGNLEIFLSTDGGATFNSQGTFNVASTWTTNSINILTNSATTVVRFTATGGGGNDIGLDNISLFPPCSSTPTAGTISSPIPCYNLPFTMTLLGSSSLGGLDYLWQSSPSATGPWTTVSPTITPSLTTQITSSTYFRCIVTCTATLLSDTTTATLVSLGSFYNCYCNSQSTTLSILQNTGNVTIKNAQGTILLNNGIGAPTLGNPSVLHYYSSFYNISPTVIYRDSTYDFSDSTYSQSNTYAAGHVNVYIDYNRDGLYDPIFELVTDGVVIGPSGLMINSFTVPANAQFGITGMRVVYKVGATSASNISPCTNYTDGETEDYLVEIKPAPCTNPPLGGIATISDIMTCPGYPVFLQDTTHDVNYGGLTFIWQVSNDGINFADLTGAIYDTLTYIVNGPTWFRFNTICNGTSFGYSNVVNVIMSSPNACYGFSQATGGAKDSSDIGAFVISDIATSNNIFSFITGGPHLNNPLALKHRTDYTANTSMYLYSDSSYTFSVFDIMKSATHADAKITIFIDYNHNQLYDIPAERVYSGIADVNNYYLNTVIHTVLTPAFNVPTGLRIVFE